MPAGGWSGRIRSVPGAIICPIGPGHLVHQAGVFDSTGAYVHEAVLWRGRPLLVPPDFPETTEYLPGRWVWGGVLHGHFGHFLMESTGRLWAMAAVKGRVDGLVFVVKRDVGDALKSWHQAFFQLLGITYPVRLITVPTRVDALDVPGQGFGIGPLFGGTAAFRDYIHAHFARDLRPVGGDRLYISRSALDVTLGGVVAETRLESLLSDCGYDIYHPQDHSLDDQVARYKAARMIVAPDGSALHLLAMVGRSDQSVAMIKRRNSSGSNGIIQHLAAFTGREPLVIDAITQNWVRSDRPGVDNYSFGELDFAALGDALHKAGFIPEDTGWTSPSADEITAAMQKIEAGLRRRKLTFTAVPRGATPPSAPTRQERQARRQARRERQAAARTS